MYLVRPANERGRADFGWLRSFHTFSFGNYHDPKWRGFRDLLVINDDRVEPGRGFGTHGHNDMEIISYVIDGAIEHRDSLGNGEIVKAGDVQRMTAGTGIRHSEFNPSKAEGLHFLQMWVLPEKQGLTPGYEQKNFPLADRRGRWQVLVSRDGAEGSLRIHQDTRLLGTLLETGDTLTTTVPAGRHGWFHVVSGSITATTSSGEVLSLVEGDGVALAGPESLQLVAGERSEAILFDLK